MDSLSLIGNWCSIIGLLVSIGTVFFTIFINKQVEQLKNKILFNSRIEDHLENLKKSNSLFYSTFKEDSKVTKSKLKEIETTVQIIIKIVPNDLKAEGKKIIDKAGNQYKNIGNSTKTGLKKCFFWKKSITINELWETYDLVNSFIDKTTSFNKDKMMSR